MYTQNSKRININSNIVRKAENLSSLWSENFHGHKAKNPVRTLFFLRIATGFFALWVENIGVEPMTFYMPCRRSSQLS